MRIRKSAMMLGIEEKFGQQLEDLLPNMLTEDGLSETAKCLGVSKATLGYWVLKLGLRVQRVVLRPGESIQINRNHGT